MIRALLIPGYLVLCLLLGGASVGGYLANLVLQLLAIPIILAALFVGRRTAISRSARSLEVLMCAMLGVLLLQLVPLPPSLWTALPGRALVADGFALLDQPLPWLPLSLAPERGLATILWMLPAVAVFLGIVRLGAFKSQWLTWALIGTTFVSIAVAAGQAGNENSPLYFYEVTNRGFGVGFFANANHQATLMVATIAFVWALFLRRNIGRDSRARAGRRLGFAAAITVLAVGLALNGSLAGLGLAVPATAAAVFMSGKVRRRINPVLTLLAIGLVGIAAVAVILLGPISNNLTGPVTGEQAETRQTSIGMTAQAGVDHLPLGSGLGSFETVYQTYEDPAVVGRRYMNHAHSDFAELFLEAGLPGVLLIFSFLAWWLARTVAIWRGGEDLYARAATISTMAILAHSVVDYPLRTVAIGALFAVCCALMAEPRDHGRRVQENEADRPRHLTA